MNKDRLTSLLFLIIGIILLFPSIFLTFRSFKIISSYETTQGKLIDLKKNGNEIKIREKNIFSMLPFLNIRM
jgi:hypothetical protein